MSPQEALEFIHSVSWMGSKPGLSRTRELLRRIGNPEKQLRFIHIAGTNGKGSTAAMLSHILSAAGYRTGLYTSPYIFRFNERMQIDNSYISDSDLAYYTELVKPHALAMQDQPTEFELITAISLAYFAAKRCSIVVLEAGMGGRLDSTNVISAPECAVITNIGLDHMKELGDTVEKIALEKAQIIKPGCTAIIYNQKKTVMDVITGVCTERGVPFRTAVPDHLISAQDGIEGQTFRYFGEEYFLPLLGAHQRNNAAVVMDTVAALRERGWNIRSSAVREGLVNTRWPARFEIVSRKPWFVVDGGHNPQCAETVSENLEYYFPRKHRVLLAGVLRDKDYEGLFDILNPAANEFIAVSPDSPRALPAAELGKFLERYGKPVAVCSSIWEGVAAALNAAGEDGVACSVGSLYMSGAVRAYFGLF